MDRIALFEGCPALLAPLAGVSDIAMRTMAREQGAYLCYTEMVSSQGLRFASERTAKLLDVGQDERSVAVQLFGHDPAVMADMAAWVEQRLGSRLAVLDVNMGCPVRKIAGKGDGAALMKDPALAGRILEAIAKRVSVPLTCKFRRGYYAGQETAPEFARMAEESGARAVTVHGRYATQLYTGASCRETIARVKECVGIPVIGNGDIRSGADAACLVEETGCDGVMVARGALGNPWVFAEVRAALDGAPQPTPPTAAERIAAARRHARIIADVDSRMVIRMRKQAGWYVRGLPGASVAREAFNRATTLQDFEEVFDRLEERVG